MTLTELVLSAVTAASVAGEQVEKPLLQQNHQGQLCLATETVRAMPGPKLKALMEQHGEKPFMDILSYLTTPRAKGGAGYTVAKEGSPTVVVEIAEERQVLVRNRPFFSEASWTDYKLSVSVQDANGHEWHRQFTSVFHGKDGYSGPSGLRDVIPPSCLSIPIQYCMPAPGVRTPEVEKAPVPECGVVYVWAGERKLHKAIHREIQEDYRLKNVTRDVESVESVPLLKFNGGRTILSCLAEKGHEDARYVSNKFQTNHPGMNDQLHVLPSVGELPLLYVEEGKDSVEVRFFDEKGVLRASPQYRKEADGNYAFTCDQIPPACKPEVKR